MISGFATSEGTENFANNSDANQLNFKKIKHLTLSNVGMGTYLGDSNEKTDDAVKKRSKAINSVWS